MWRFYLLQTDTPLIGSSFEDAAEVGIDSFQWTISLGSDSLTTVSSFNAGADEAGTVELPWSAVCADDKFTAARMLQTGKYSILMCWEEGGETYPVLWGAIGERTDTWFGTSFALDTIWDLLDARLPYSPRGYMPNGVFVDAPDAEDLSRRGLVATVGEFIDEGNLPEIDWQYAGEEGDYSYDLNTIDEIKTYTMAGYINYVLNDVYLGNRAGKFDVSPEYESAPCASFRPELYNNDRYWRLVFVADSDEDEELEVARTFTVDEISDWQCQHLQPYEEVQIVVSYDSEQADDMIASASDETYTALGYPLRQICTSVSKDEYQEAWSYPQEYYVYTNLRADAELEYQNQPLAQMSFSVPCDGVVGQLWPGDKIALDIEEEDDFPVLPATYEGRIIEMNGNNSFMVTITMEPLQDSLYYSQYQLD